MTSHVITWKANGRRKLEQRDKPPEVPLEGLLVPDKEDVIASRLEFLGRPEPVAVVISKVRDGVHRVMRCPTNLRIIVTKCESQIVGGAKPGERLLFVERPLVVVARSALPLTTGEPTHEALDRIAKEKEDGLTRGDITDGDLVRMADYEPVGGESKLPDGRPERRATGLAHVKEVSHLAARPARKLDQEAPVSRTGQGPRAKNPTPRRPQSRLRRCRNDHGANKLLRESRNTTSLARGLSTVRCQSHHGTDVSSERFAGTSSCPKYTAESPQALGSHGGAVG